MQKRSGVKGSLIMMVNAGCKRYQTDVLDVEYSIRVLIDGRRVVFLLFYDFIGGNFVQVLGKRRHDTTIRYDFDIVVCHHETYES